ncbi:hypothetical protein F5X98DRAFT_347522 [Xylaria grammica]|nr:hypothetical protein F5X98DRAFT_347522 [Xylaria grammica]
MYPPRLPPQFFCWYRAPGYVVFTAYVLIMGNGATAIWDVSSCRIHPRYVMYRGECRTCRGEVHYIYTYYTYVYVTVSGTVRYT